MAQPAAPKGWERFDKGAFVGAGTDRMDGFFTAFEASVLKNTPKPSSDSAGLLRSSGYNQLIEAQNLLVAFSPNGTAKLTPFFPAGFPAAQISSYEHVNDPWFATIWEAVFVRIWPALRAAYMAFASAENQKEWTFAGDGWPCLDFKLPVSPSALVEVERLKPFSSSFGQIAESALLMLTILTRARPVRKRLLADSDFLDALMRNGASDYVVQKAACYRDGAPLDQKAKGLVGVAFGTLVQSLGIVGENPTKWSRDRGATVLGDDGEGLVFATFFKEFARWCRGMIPPRPCANAAELGSLFNAFILSSPGVAPVNGIPVEARMANAKRISRNLRTEGAPAGHGNRIAPMAPPRAAAALAALLLALFAAAAHAAEGQRGRNRANDVTCVSPATVLQPATPALVLPNRVVANRDPSIKPEFYFDFSGTVGSGHFGSVRIAALRSAEPGPLDPPNVRLFAIKSQFYDPNDQRVIPKKTAIADRLEPHFMSVANGGPYLIHFWGVWRERTPDRNTFTIAMPVAASDLEAEIQGLSAKFFPGTNPIPEAKARILLAQLALAIGHLHAKGIIHRDIKAANILIDGKRRPMLGDFGCSVNVSRVLQEWEEMGTCDYRIVAPEIFTAGPRAYDFPNQAPYGRASDWWSYGVVAYNTLTRTTSRTDANDRYNGPFKIVGQRAWSNFWRTNYGRQVDPSEYLDFDRWRAEGITAQAADFITKLLHWDPSKRLGRSSRDRSARQGWQAVFCHPFLAQLTAERLIRAGERQAAELNTAIRFTTPNGRPPAPRGAREQPAPAVARQIQATTEEVRDAYDIYFGDDFSQEGQTSYFAPQNGRDDDEGEGGGSSRGAGGSGGSRGGSRRPPSEEGESSYFVPANGNDGRSRGSSTSSGRGGSRGGNKLERRRLVAEAEWRS
ncbi:kinase-like domain-containing protein [Hyaloraphidium curvatum]|nr:kinase-like domain-containing protein [Hyaloraphidium curvatum]